MANPKISRWLVPDEKKACACAIPMAAIGEKESSQTGRKKRMRRQRKTKLQISCSQKPIDRGLPTYGSIAN